MTTPTPGQPLSEADAKSGHVYVEVSGLTGTGKSAVMGEIEIALKALGLSVEHDGDFQAEKNGTHADWQEALDLYRPTVVLRERNISRPHAPVSRPGDGVEGERPVITMTDVFERPFTDIDDPRLICARNLTRAEAEAVLEFRGDLKAALTPPAEPVSRPAGEGEREAVALKVASAMLEYAPIDRSHRFSERAKQVAIISNECADRILSLLSPAAPDAGGGDDKLRTLADRVVAEVKRGSSGSSVQALGALSNIEEMVLSALQPGGER